MLPGEKLGYQCMGQSVVVELVGRDRLGLQQGLEGSGVVSHLRVAPGDVDQEPGSPFGEQLRHLVELHRRDTAELLAEELRRLTADEIYGETLARFSIGAGR